MKKLYYYVMSLAFLFALTACSDDDEPTPAPPPSKGAEAVNKIVEVLEEEAEISTFVEILKSVDVANLEEDKLTVFAVRNATQTRASGEVLDSASIKRHIAVGSYQKAELKDGMVLKSINGESLHVSHSGDGGVYINGVPIEGDAIAAGNSYVYIIPEVLTEQLEKRYITTIEVQELWADKENPLTPLAGVTVTVQDGSGTQLGEWTTGAEGTVVIKHDADSIMYQIKKEGYSEGHDGYLLKGLNANGDYAYADLNGDGKYDALDKVASFPYPYFLSYKDMEDTKTTQTCYMLVITPETDLAKIATEWDAATEEYFKKVLELESALVTGSGGFAYTEEEFVFYSNPVWNIAYDMLDKGAEYAKQLASMEVEAQELLTDINVDMAIIRCHLYGYYGQLLGDKVSLPVEQLIQDLKKARDEYPSAGSHAVTLLLAKVYADEERWNEALECCERIANSGEYQLTNLGYPTEKEVIWSGHKYMTGDGSEVRTPLLLYREVYLLAAVANYGLGRQAEVAKYIELLKELFQEDAGFASTPESLADMAQRLLQGHGGWVYPYYRILNTPISSVNNGFDASKNYLLPIPQQVLDENPNIMQNPGYN